MTDENRVSMREDVAREGERERWAPVSPRGSIQRARARGRTSRRPPNCKTRWASSASSPPPSLPPPGTLRSLTITLSCRPGLIFPYRLVCDKRRHPHLTKLTGWNLQLDIFGRNHLDSNLTTVVRLVEIGVAPLAWNPCAQSLRGL